ncbi:Phage-related protein [Desulfomicrobium apsheronum]|uniref:Phage-related protein n=2 Tax=Desulfomicrobium TaxID=898 RepID=A0A1I3YJC5_9BACT|nr:MULTISPECIES: type II toxin-antitoxin system RelE/ParE family toxin [Desulfomicrobium]MBE1425988.1 phage-related protein [Desulfomicrobium macestii]SFK31276.1 Phage-related protein [Desulfomicrobium apsheronum]
MKIWKVELLEEALGEFKELPAEIRARFQRIFGLVADMGQDALCMPHARRIQGRIWEMRAQGRDGIARGLYVMVTGRRVVVVRFFVKKTQKTPLNEIHLALKRCGENEI